MSKSLDALLNVLEDVPIVGGCTSVTLTSAATLASLGLSVGTLGDATAADSNGNLVATFPITGGTEGANGGGDVILHDGSGLSLSDNSGDVVDLANFRVDTQNGTIAAQVTADHQVAGEVDVFSIGAGGALTLTTTAAAVLDQTFGTTALTTQTPIGTAAPAPLALAPGEGELIQVLSALAGLPAASGSSPMAFISGETAVTLSAEPVLASLGVTVKGLGAAILSGSGSSTTATFPITGGTGGPEGDTILHDGSGLSLSDMSGKIALRDFTIDTANAVVNANVKIDGKSAGNVGVFSIGPGDQLALTTAGAGAVAKALGTAALGAGTVIGTAAPQPFALSSQVASLLGLHTS